MKRTPRFAVPLITPENRKMFFWPAAFFVYLSYTFTSKYQVLTPWHPWSSPIDEAIPLMPWTIWIYLSHVALMFSAWWYMVRGEGCTRIFWSLVLAALISTCYFLLFPTEIPRRFLDSIHTDPATMAAWAFMIAADEPTNCFPSMHVAEAVLATIGLIRGSDRWRIAAPIWATLIILSTMTTKQHVLIDVLGGIGLAILCFWLVERFLVVEHMPPGEAEPAS